MVGTLVALHRALHAVLWSVWHGVHVAVGFEQLGKRNWNKLTFLRAGAPYFGIVYPPTVLQEESNARGFAAVPRRSMGDIAHVYVFCVPNVTAATRYA